MIDNNSSGRGSGKLFGDAPVASAEDFIADEQTDADHGESQQECITGTQEESGAAEEPCGKISTSARQNRPEDQFPADELFLSTDALIREEDVPGEPAAVPLGFVYSESGELQRCTPAGFERCLDCLRNSTNLLSLGSCTYLMKIELMKKMLEQRFDFSEGGDQPPLQRELFSASRGIFGVSTVLYGIEELFRCISRYFGLERNRIEETLVQCHGGMTVMPDGTTVSFSRYEERLFSEIFDAIAQLGIERELLVPFFESIAGENYLPSQIREQICTLLYENSSADGKISLDDLIENFFALYRDHYNRMITSAEQRRYPLYDVYLNIRLYYYHARQIIMKGERTGGIDVSGLSEKMKQLLALKLKNCLEVQIRNRPLLVEIQGLTNPVGLGNPRRTPIGVDINRLFLITAVLTRRIGIRLGEQDVFVNVVGGMRIAEPAADLAIAAAIVSSAKNRPIRADAVLIGEIGLSGELRGANKITDRLKEAAKLGFTLAVIPRVSQKTRESFPKNMEVIEARSLREALRAVLLPEETKESGTRSKE